MSAPIGFTATFVTNVYRGRDANGTPEPLPDPVRLMSTLQAAAARSSLGVAGADAALRWFEDHPPAYMSVPKSITSMCDKKTHFFKNSGSTKKEGPIRRYSETADYAYGYALDGNVAWGWDSVPDEHAEVFKELVRFIGYLGDTDSVATLTWGELDEPTHVLDNTTVAYGSVHAFVPSKGRTNELDARHARIAKGKTSTNTRGDQAISAAAKLSRDTRRFVMSATYVPVEVEAVYALDAPWNAAVWFPMKKSVRPEDAVALAGKVHAELVRKFSNTYGERCAVLHGRARAEDAEHHGANNVAIQFIPGEIEHARGTSPGMLVMVPTDAPLGDRDSLLSLIETYSPKHDLLVGSRGEEVDPTQWWRPSQIGHRRLWATHPVAVTEAVGRPLAILASESLRHVFRGQLSKKSGIGAVINAKRVDPHVGLGTFIHRTSGDKATNIARHHAAYTAVYDLTDVSTETAVVAVGQSRHFSTGLLVPIDIPNTN